MAPIFEVFVDNGAFASATGRYVIAKPAVMRGLRRGLTGAFSLRLALTERCPAPVR